MREETEKWLQREMVKKEKKAWDNFANSAWLLAEFYPQLQESDIWLKLNELGLITEGKN